MGFKKNLQKVIPCYPITLTTPLSATLGLHISTRYTRTAAYTILLNIISDALGISINSISYNPFLIIVKIK